MVNGKKMPLKFTTEKFCQIFLTYFYLFIFFLMRTRFEDRENAAEHYFFFNFNVRKTLSIVAHGSSEGEDEGY